MSGQRLCYPYGAGISCTCDARKRILRCVPVVDSHQSARVGAGALEDGLYDDVEPVLDEELGQAKVGDERTEIILAATFLLIVILSFIAFIIHRCERNLYQRKHLGCPGDSSRAGCDGGGSTVVKSLSSVSIQTVPVMAGPGHVYGNGEISTISRAVNGGGTRLQDVHIAMEALGQHQMGGGGQFFYRPPSIQSQDHVSPDSHHPQSPPAPPDHPHLYQESHQYRVTNNEDMIETTMAGLELEYNDRTKM